MVAKSESEQVARIAIWGHRKTTFSRAVTDVISNTIGFFARAQHVCVARYQSIEVLYIYIGIYFEMVYT